ncbi:MAG: menaquinone biosynthesis protein [Clostridia bacterium]|nr:menaquinone biosynthesis protein [Clostridia bacterium]MDQ7790618.1 menaquinone biosynthesis protein [Clostridia bacterium]
MSEVRLGQVDYLNCLPVYHPLETGLLPPQIRLIRGVPTFLNDLFLRGELDVTPISSIEYARNPGRCLILPDLSVSSDGRVGSIFLFSKVPVTDLEGCRICLTGASATSVALLKILLKHYYQVDVVYETGMSGLEEMLLHNDAALLIGDQALITYHGLGRGKGLYVTDLGEAWKEFTGERMVYALWAVQRDFAEHKPVATGELYQLLQTARRLGAQRVGEVLESGHLRTGLPTPVLREYFDLIRHDLDEEYQRGLLRFCDYAFKTGLLEERVRLNIWSDR